MSTTRLFDQDAYLGEFEATVERSVCEGGMYRVLLDRTAFFPEGGGQPADEGTLDGIFVTDVQEIDGEIWHTVEAPLEPGKTVVGKLDFEKRFSNMQNHCGEHIVSGIVHRIYGFNNVGFHMGSDVITVDFDGVLTEEQLYDVEQEANEAVLRNVPVTISYPSKEELETMDYRSKKEIEGQVRIVTIENADICACCGTHVTRTGEIGLIKIFSCVKFHEGVRLEILCGMRAYEYVNRLMEQNRKNSALLSAKPTETNAAAERMAEELAGAKYRVSQLENELFSLKAKAYAGESNVLLFESAMSPDAVRRFADAILAGCTGRIAIFAGDDEQGYKYALCKKDGDLRETVKALNAACNGRGGGKPFFAQGSVQASRAQLEAFFASLG